MTDTSPVRPLGGTPPGWYACGTGIIYLPGMPLEDVEQVIRELESTDD